MRSEHLFSGGELCLKILSQSTYLEKPILPDDKAAQKFFEQIHFPAYTQAEIKSMSTDLENGVSVRDVLINHSFAFPFYLSQLDSLLRTVDKRNVKFTSLFVLYTYLSWIVTFSECDAVDPTLTHLLAALASVSDSTLFAAAGQLRLLTVSAFTDLYTTSLTTKNVSDASDFLSPLYLLFEGCVDLPDPCYEMLCIVARWIADQDREIGSQMNMFFLFVSKLKKPEVCYQELTKIAVKSVGKRNSELYLYLPSFTDCLSQNFLGGFLSTVPMALIQLIENEKVISVIGKNDHHQAVVLPEANSVEVVLRFQPVETFVNGLCVDQAVEFPKLMRLQQLVGDWIIPRLSVVAQVATKSRDHIRTIVVNFTELARAEAGNEHIYDIFAVYLYLMRLFPPDLVFELQLDSLFNDVLFSPKVTVFDEVEGWTTLNSLRFYALETLIGNRPTVVEEILTNTMIYPLLFTEILHRFNAYHDLVPTDVEARNLMARGLMSAALFYQSFAGSDMPEIETARTGIFFLISHLFLDNSILTQFFDNHAFSYSFLSFVFEKSLRKHILEHLLVYLTSKSSDPLTNSEMPQIVLEIVDMACISLPQTESLLLIDSIFGTINEAMMHRRELTKIFEPLTNTILRAIMQLDSKEESRSVLENAMQFMALTASVHPLKITERDAIETAVRTVYGDNPSQKVFERLVQLSAGEYIQSLSPSFHVRQYKVLKTFVLLFSNSDKLADVLVFIKDLCSYAVENAISCNKSEIDLWIIEMIQRAMTDPSLHKFVDPGLELLTNIACKVSSVSVVLRFIELLCPTTSQLSIFQEKILRAMNSIIGGTTKEPIVWIQMTSEFKTRIDGVTGAMLEDGFAFVCWVKLDTSITQYKPRLLRIFETDQKGIDMYFNYDQLNIEQQTDEYNTSAHIDIRVPSKVWTLIALKYEKLSDEDVVLHAKVNTEKWESIDIPNMKWRPRSLLKIDIGNLRQGSVSPEFPSKFAGFTLLKTVSDELLESFWESGPTADFGSPKDCIFSFHPILQGTDFGFDMYQCDKGIHLVSSYPRVLLAVPFTNILIHSCKIDLILPLFLQLPLKTPDNKPIPHFLDMIIDMLANLLSSNQRSETMFLEYKGFGVISNLLLQLPPELIDYSMYNLFFGLLESLTVPQLQEQLIDEILLNLDIWMLADPDNHLRIVKHWYRVMFPSYSPVIAKVRPFSDMLTCLQYYYSYDSHFVKEKSLDVCEIRNTIMHSYMTMKFKRVDILSLIGHIIATTNAADIIDLLRFLMQIIERGQVTAEVIGNAFDASTLFLYLLNQKNEDVCCLVFDVIFAIHRKQLISPCKAYEHIRVILHQLTPDFVGRSLFRRLIDMMLKQDYFELLTIVCWVALNLPDVEKRWLIVRLEPSKGYCTDTFWAFWTLMLATKLVEVDLQKRLLMFVIISESNNWMNIYTTLDAIGCIFDVEVCCLKQLFLQIMVETLLEKKVEATAEQVAVYFKTVARFIMCHTSTKQNRALDWAYRDSPFMTRLRHPSLKMTQLRKFRSAAGGQLKHVSNFTGSLSPTRAWPASRLSPPTCLMPFQLEQKFRIFIDRPPAQHIGLRLSLNEQWLDADLAKKCVQLCGQWGSRYLEFDLVMCLFLMRTQPEFVISHLNSLNLTPKDISENQQLLGMVSRLAGKYDFKWAIVPSVSALEGLNQFMAALPASKKEVLTGSSELSRARAVIRERSEKMLSMIDDEVITNSRKNLAEMKSRCESRNRYNAKLWQRLWKCMTVDKAPWSGYKYKEKRFEMLEDVILCGGICPMKIRRVSMTGEWSNESESLQVSTTDGDKDDLRASEFAKKVLWEAPARITARYRTIRIQFCLCSSAIHLRMPSHGMRKVLPFVFIVQLLLRSRGHKQTAIEIFLCNGKSLIVDFIDQDSLQILKQIQALIPKTVPVEVQTVPWKEFVNSKTIIQEWVEGKLSNFKYLTLLNLYSGRSFNDFSQYPLFPWVLSDYSSDKLDLSSPGTFRDLRKPMIATDQKSLNELITSSMSKHYDSFILQRFVLTAPDVCGYLANFAPFNKATEGFQLKSIQDAFCRASKDESECRELIPELFALPELLSGVELPKWCESPTDFIYLHRKALESDYVSQNLHYWIDLIWGVKQRGAEADISFNSFPKELYDDFNTKEAPDVLFTTLRAKGIVPHEIFQTWHPKRQKAPKQQPVFSSPITVQIQTNEIIYACIRHESSMTYSITYIDTSGSVVTSRFNFVAIDKSMKKFGCTRTASNDISPPDVTKPNKRIMLRTNIRSLPHSNDIMPSSGGIVSMPSFEDNRCFPQPIEIPQARTSLPNFSQYLVNTTLMSNFITSFGRSIAIVNGHKRYLSLVDIHSGSKTKVKSSSTIACIAENQGWLVTASVDPVLSLFDVRELQKPIYSMPLYRDEITCCAVSASFQLIVAGTRDGYLVLSSMNRGSIDHVIDLGGCRPYAVSITESWGFIVVCATKLDCGKVEHILHVYNVNGTLIRKKPIAHQMNAWTTWSSQDGFDFMMIATEKGKLFWFEVYYLNFTDLTEYRQTYPIVALRCTPSEGGVVAVGCYGAVHFIPFIM